MAGINMYDNPAEGKFIDTYVPIDFNNLWKFTAVTEKRMDTAQKNLDDFNTKHETLDSPYERDVMDANKMFQDVQDVIQTADAPVGSPEWKKLEREARSKWDQSKWDQYALSGKIGWESKKSEDPNWNKELYNQHYKEYSTSESGIAQGQGLPEYKSLDDVYAKTVDDVVADAELMGGYSIEELDESKIRDISKKVSEFYKEDPVAQTHLDQQIATGQPGSESYTTPEGAIDYRKFNEDNLYNRLIAKKYRKEEYNAAGKAALRKSALKPDQEVRAPYSRFAVGLMDYDLASTQASKISGIAKIVGSDEYKNDLKVYREASTAYSQNPNAINQAKFEVADGKMKAHKTKVKSAIKKQQNKMLSHLRNDKGNVEFRLDDATDMKVIKTVGDLYKVAASSSDVMDYLNFEVGTGDLKPTQITASYTEKKPGGTTLESTKLPIYGIYVNGIKGQSDGDAIVDVADIGTIIDIEDPLHEQNLGRKLYTSGMPGHFSPKGGDNALTYTGSDGGSYYKVEGDMYVTDTEVSKNLTKAEKEAAISKDLLIRVKQSGFNTNVYKYTMYVDYLINDIAKNRLDVQRSKEGQNRKDLTHVSEAGTNPNNEIVE